LSLTNTNIESLIELCKVQNQKAQMEIYNRYYKAMFNTSYRIVKDHFEAEDIMQESFLTAFSKLDTLKDISTFGSWLKRIVINNSIQHYKKSDTHKSMPLDDILYKVEDSSSTLNSDELSEKSLKVNTVVKAMNTLKDNYRIALSLHFIEGYDYEEMCTIMDISYSNCRTTVSRAKESLRKRLQTSA